MTDHYANAPPVCQRTPEELRAVITEALQILGPQGWLSGLGGSEQLQQLAAEAMQQLPAAVGAAAPAGAVV
jgi:hypothetical protein